MHLLTRHWLDYDPVALADTRDQNRHDRAARVGTFGEVTDRNVHRNAHAGLRLRGGSVGDERRQLYPAINFPAPVSCGQVLLS